MTITTTYENVRLILQSDFPHLNINHIHLLGEGWDSVAVLVNGDLVIRLPKRDATARQMEKEVCVLQAIRPYITANIPDFTMIGRREDGVMISAVGYPMLEGIPLSDLGVPVTAKFGPQIGRFLNELHAVPIEVLRSANIPWFHWTGDESDVGPNGWRSGLCEFADRVLQQVVPLLQPGLREIVIGKITSFSTNPRNFRFIPVLLHGDFAPEHILIHPQSGELSIIDFGDSGLGDPAYDVWPGLMPYYHGANVVHDETFTVRQTFYRWLAPFHGVIHGLMAKDDVLVANGLRQIAANSP